MWNHILNHIVISHVEPNVEVSGPTHGCSQYENPYVHVDKHRARENHRVNPILVDGHSIDTPIIDQILNDIINENCNPSKDSYGEEDEGATRASKVIPKIHEEVSKEQKKKDVCAEESEDIPIAHILNNLTKIFTKSRDMDRQLKGK